MARQWAVDVAFVFESIDAETAGDAARQAGDMIRSGLVQGVMVTDMRIRLLPEPEQEPLPPGQGRGYGDTP